MPRTSKPKAPPRNVIQDAMKKIRASHNLGDTKKGTVGIVDIETFCDSSDYLDLPHNNAELYKSQRIVLKCLYMGSRGNEHVKLTPDEMQWLYDKKQTNALKMLERRDKGEKFRISELVLVIGRRGSKTFIASIISAYELYKILNVGGGDPYKFYGIATGQEIAIMNVATSRKQAGRLFFAIKNRIRGCRVFNGRIANVTNDEIRIYTDDDLAKLNNPSLNVPVEGSVVVVCGHSNPDSLRGYSIICLLFDELAYYDEAEKVSGTEFYNALAPSVGDFSNQNDGLIIEISTPGPKTGIFYKLWDNSSKIPNMMSFQVPTWEFNPKKPYDDPELVKFRTMDPDAFDVEFGAQWPEGTMFGTYFPEALIKDCIRMELVPEDEPEHGVEYFFHIDPSGGGDRFAMAAVKRTFCRDAYGKTLPRIVLAFTRTFEPEGDRGLNYMKIDQEILDLCIKYRPVTVTFDQWNSPSSIEMLRANGIRAMSTSFNRGYKNKIYQNLRELMARPEIGLWLYEEPLLLAELKSLKYRPTPRGYCSIGADPRSDTPTDDMCDCLAGAAFMAAGNYYRRLPQGILVNTGYR